MAIMKKEKYIIVPRIVPRLDSNLPYSIVEIHISCKEIEDTLDNINDQCMKLTENRRNGDYFAIMREELAFAILKYLKLPLNDNHVFTQWGKVNILASSTLTDSVVVGYQI